MRLFKPKRLKNRIDIALSILKSGRVATGQSIAMLHSCSKGNTSSWPAQTYALVNTSAMRLRWVAARRFAWLLQKNRRLWTNCDRLLNAGLQFIHLAFLALRLKRL